MATIFHKKQGVSRGWYPLLFVGVINRDFLHFGNVYQQTKLLVDHFRRNFRGGRFKGRGPIFRNENEAPAYDNPPKKTGCGSDKFHSGA